MSIDIFADRLKSFENFWLVDLGQQVSWPAVKMEDEKTGESYLVTIFFTLSHHRPHMLLPAGNRVLSLQED
jgi:hypothetical protein